MRMETLYDKVLV